MNHLINMRLNLLILTLLALISSGCGVKGGGGSINNNPTVTPGSYLASLIQQPSLEAIKSVAFADDIQIEFSKNGVVQAPPASSAYFVRAYTDSTCTTPASGTVTFNRSVSNLNILTLSNVKYSGVGDIYLGISGSNVTKVCSQKIQVLSASPVNFTVTDGSGASGPAGGVTTTLVKFKVLDNSSPQKPVQNAHLKIGTTVSPASNALGEISWNVPLPESAAVLNTTVTATLFTLTNGNLHSEDVTVSVFANAAKTIEISDMPQTSLAVNTISDPIRLVARDLYSNPVHPDNWIFSYDVFSDSTCTTPGDPTTYANVQILGVDNNIPDTYASLYIYAFDTVGTVYFKFTLVGGTSSVCSPAISITP